MKLNKLPSIPEPPILIKRPLKQGPAPAPDAKQEIQEIKNKLKQLSSLPKWEDYKRLVKDFKQSLDSIRAEAKADVDKYLNEKEKALMSRLQAVSKSSEKPEKVPRDLLQTDQQLQALKLDMSRVREHLLSEMKRLRESDIPELMAGFEKKLSEFQASVSTRLDEIEKATKTSINGVLAETDQKLAGLKRQISEQRRAIATERSYFERSFKGLEKSFSTELAKVIEWINYFNNKLD